MDGGIGQAESFGQRGEGHFIVWGAEDGGEDLALLARTQDGEQGRRGAPRPSIHRLNCNSQSVEDWIGETPRGSVVGGGQALKWGSTA
jgi:hypothetical protein